MSDTRMYFADNQDAALQAGYVAARHTFKFFWRELSWEYRRIVPGLDMAAVKLPFATDSAAQEVHAAPTHEHMWISDVHFDGEQISGSLDYIWIKYFLKPFNPYFICCPSIFADTDSIILWQLMIP